MFDLKPLATEYAHGALTAHTRRAHSVLTPRTQRPHGDYSVFFYYFFSLVNQYLLVNIYIVIIIHVAQLIKQMITWFDSNISDKCDIQKSYLELRRKLKAYTMSRFYLKFGPQSRCDRCLERRK